MFEYIIGAKSHSFILDDVPDVCPHCNYTIQPIPIMYNEVDQTMEFIFRCANKYCRRAFISKYYRANEYFEYWQTQKSVPIDRKFTEHINLVSEAFVKIYNQAYSAEQYGLTEICGVGYRKALEFLIKDYSIKNNPSEEKKIKNEYLKDCIKNYIDDMNIQFVAERAAWLGNDETHYIRKWDEHDVQDLKKLIDLTIFWIEAVETTNELKISMANGKK